MDNQGHPILTHIVVFPQNRNKSRCEGHHIVVGGQFSSEDHWGCQGDASPRARVLVTEPSFFKDDGLQPKNKSDGLQPIIIPITSNLILRFYKILKILTFQLLQSDLTLQGPMQ